jgi:hypothetical protein
MIKLLITATSFALGSAGVGLVGYLSAHPMAFTHAVAALPAVNARHTFAVAPVAVEAPGNTLVLGEVRITASRKKPNQKSTPIGLSPCTDWNDVGAVLIEPEGATGVRQVRTLCSKPSDARWPLDQPQQVPSF